jgi:hypothetical protein
MISIFDFAICKIYFFHYYRKYKKIFFEMILMQQDLQKNVAKKLRAFFGDDIELDFHDEK